MTDITDLPTQMVLLTRDQSRDRYLRSYKIRNPDADVGPGNQPFLDASSHADSLVPLYADARLVGDATNDRSARGAWLDAKLEAAGLERDGAVGATGFVIVSASAGGGTIYAEDALRHLPSGQRYKCLATAVYLNGKNVPITGIDVGPTTNLPPGSILDWESPRAGIGPRAVVFEEGDGSGLSGGHPAETDEEAQDKLIAARRYPPAAGNDAEYQRVMRETPGIAVQQPFTHSTALGPGTTACCFLLRPASPGSSRVPNGAQIAQVLANLQNTEAADDGIFVGIVVEEPTTTALGVVWARRSATWVDVSPWPESLIGLTLIEAPATPITATFFRVTSTDTQAAPVVGQTIALFNRETLRFVRKRIAAVVVHTLNLSWDITCDTTNSASDTAFIPVVGQAVSPWSDSLQLLVPVVVDYYDTLGPGEQFGALPDPGTRQRRMPEAPESWPHTITDRITDGLFDLPAVNDIELLAPETPTVPTVGTPGVLSYLLTLGDLAVYPKKT